MQSTIDVEPNAVPAASVLLQSESLSTERSSPSRSPRRIHTEPKPDVGEGAKPRPFKRIAVFCDGTWQDGLSAKRSQYTNVLRLSRAVNYHDERDGKSIPQIVFYQPGVGTDGNLYSEYVEGATGASLAGKVEEAYGFIAQNYCPGDEIFLFGFSRGAYTARMVAMFIGEIGVLDRKDMDHFNRIFIDYQTLGKTTDQNEKQKLEDKLAPWRDSSSKGKQRVDVDNDKFSIKCLGVWDTVGAIGLPEEIMIPKKTINLFGFQDRNLGPHVEHAFQALALNEMRKDFNCNKFIQTEEGKQKKQTLKQVWFAGCHSDIGGGYKHHDLSDITLFWMVSQIELYLSVDTHYLEHLIKPVAAWGKQQPHDSLTGIFLLADKVQRELPVTADDPKTHEFLHPSILEQSQLDTELSDRLAKVPGLITPLTELEEQIKQRWPYDPSSKRALEYAAKLKAEQDMAATTAATKSSSILRTVGKLWRSISGSSPPEEEKVQSVDVTETTTEKVVAKRRSLSGNTLIGRSTTVKKTRATIQTSPPVDVSS
ncbi:hypothetical protein D9613_001768 [Agrocybe pediades]|uniref:T6SS Phospholipase effector Tle1-like catalytic domain-containing protein n=1 Tax=Agrocybe pediades TaxID=84607 RepID=A0A8H4R3U8_9AGAR|nr:hypothetical protein D9613_001768 [Agrocybe pediades]